MQERDHLKSGGSSLFSPLFYEKAKLFATGQDAEEKHQRAGTGIPCRLHRYARAPRMAANGFFFRMFSTLISRKTEVLEDQLRPSRQRDALYLCSLEYGSQRLRCCSGRSPPNYPDIVKYQVRLALRSHRVLCSSLHAGVGLRLSWLCQDMTTA